MPKGFSYYNKDQIFSKNNNLKTKFDNIVNAQEATPFTLKDDQGRMNNLYSIFIKELDKTYSKQEIALHPQLRRERDSFKYEAITIIKSKFEYISPPSKEALEIIEYYNKEAMKASNILSGKEEANKNITTSKDLPSLTETIGKRTWTQFFGDLVRGDLHIAQQIKQTISSTLNKFKNSQNIAKENFNPPSREDNTSKDERTHKDKLRIQQKNIDSRRIPPIPTSPAPSVFPTPPSRENNISKEERTHKDKLRIQQKNIDGGRIPPIPTSPAPKLKDMPKYAPPPVPNFKEKEQKRKDSKESQEEQIRQ
jgi:hypothetical protein